MREKWFVREENCHVKEASVSYGEKLYQQAVDCVRDSRFYSDYQIDDTPLGRFELLSIHLFLLLRRLKEEGSETSKSISQAICNLFVADMDHSLRDMRVSELKADKQFKKFVEGFYGRLLSYDQAIDSGDPAMVRSNSVEVFLKNVYNGIVQNRKNAENMADHVLRQLSILRRQKLLELNFGKYDHDIIRNITP